MLEKLLRSGAEVKLLGVVLFNDGLHLREIARRADIFVSEAKKELDTLVSLGVLGVQRKGRMAFYYANVACPFLKDLRRLYLVTEGFVPMLKKALSGINGIGFAFVYGSIAAGDFREKSDVDVLVVGSAGEDAVSEAILSVQKKTGREINFVLWTKRDFSKKLKERGSFINSLIKGRKIWLMGDGSEFAGIVG